MQVLKKQLGFLKLFHLKSNKIISLAAGIFRHFFSSIDFLNIVFFVLLFGMRVFYLHLFLFASFKSSSLNRQWNFQPKSSYSLFITIIHSLQQNNGIFREKPHDNSLKCIFVVLILASHQLFGRFLMKSTFTVPSILMVDSWAYVCTRRYITKWANNLLRKQFPFTKSCYL